MKISPVTVTTIRTVNCADRTEKEAPPEFITLEEAGLEESSADSAFDCVGIFVYADWFWDNSSSEYDE
jgi:hypothetical protein